MATATEQALIDAYGDPRGILDQSVMTNILGLTDAPAIDPMGLVNVTEGGGISDTNIYGQTGNFPIQQAPWAGTSEVGSFLSPELESQRNLLDKLFASGVMAAPEGYESSVDSGVIPEHEMSSDTYGYQAGLKAALAKQGGPWQSTLYGGKQILSNLLGRQPDILKEVKESESARALEAYNAAQMQSVGDEYIRHTTPPDYNLMDRLSAAYQYLAPTSTASESLVDKASRILFREAEASPVVREEALRIAPSAVQEAIRSRDISRLPPYLGPLDETPNKTEWFGRRSDDVRFPYPETGFQGIPIPISREQEIENMIIEDRAAQLKFHPASPLYEAPFEEGTGPEEVSEERVVEIKKKPKEKRTSVEEQVVVASEVKKALDNASKGKKVKKELKAIVELAKVDPTIVKRYTTPGSQALQDITAQVDSFSFMPTIQKKKKQPVVDPWAFEDRRGGRR
jgi:hypothetical protein